MGSCKEKRMVGKLTAFDEMRVEKSEGSLWVVDSVTDQNSLLPGLESLKDNLSSPKHDSFKNWCYTKIVSISV